MRVLIVVFLLGIFSLNAQNIDVKGTVKFGDEAIAYAALKFTNAEKVYQTYSNAEGKFFFDNSSWMLPQTEDEYRDGIRLFNQ